MATAKHPFRSAGGFRYCDECGLCFNEHPQTPRPEHATKVLPIQRRAFDVWNRTTGEHVRVTFEQTFTPDIPAHPSRTDLFDVLIEDLDLNNIDSDDAIDVLEVK